MALNPLEMAALAIQSPRQCCFEPIGAVGRQVRRERCFTRPGPAKRACGRRSRQACWQGPVEGGRYAWFARPLHSKVQNQHPGRGFSFPAVSVRIDHRAAPNGHTDHKNDAFGGSTECRITSWKSAIAGLDSRIMIFSDAYGRLRRRHLWLLNSINIFSIK